MRLNARFGSLGSAKLVPVRTFVRSSLDSSAQSTARRRFARIIVAWAFTNTTKGMAGNEQVAGCALRAPVTRGGGCSLVARARATATLVLPRRVMDARGGP